MIGAIVGDIVGSSHEFNSIKSTRFNLFDNASCYTDDSVMTMAVAEWLLDDANHSHNVLEEKMVKFGSLNPDAGYGGMFASWLFFPEYINKSGKRVPYNSFGNGSAMRVSAVGWLFDTLEETEKVAEISASITHNHSEGIKGAQATASAIWMARNGKSKQEIKNYISTKYGYNLDQTCDDIRPKYGFDVTCQGSVPEAIVAFLDSTDYESTIRLAVSLGGDSDTQACIAGGIAEAFYKDIPQEIVSCAMRLLPGYFKETLKRFYNAANYHPEYIDMEQKETKLERYTPDFIRTLEKNEIFVFGSNLAGAHGGGAARIAMNEFGAVWGQGVGLQGQSYAIPTMQGGVETIKPYVDEFIEFAKAHPEYKFLVTRIGCGIAGFTDEEIAPLFLKAHNLENVWLPESFWK
jgi:ADP-ribosylglycohydrolase